MIDDFALLDHRPDEVSIPGNVRNAERLAQWSPIDNVYLSSASQSQFENIAGLIDPVSLTLDMVKTDHFAALCDMKRLTTLVIDSNARIASLDFLLPLTGLKHLELRAIKNTLDLQPLSRLTGLETLILDGGFSRTMNAISLEPLASLKGVSALELIAIRFKDQSLAPLAKMSSLVRLQISNYFPTESYAELFALRPDIECDRLAPYMVDKATHYTMSESGQLIADDNGGYFVTGKRKPFVRVEEAHKLTRYVEEWDRLVAAIQQK